VTMAESGEAAGAELITARDLTLAYGERPVLRGVSLTVRAGEFWFLLGPNGAGKSTLLRAVLGAMRPRSGTLLRREDVLRPDRIGFVPQRCDLNPSMPTTVREFVSLGLVGIRCARSDEPRRMAFALERTGLDGMELRDYWSLSGGQRQRALLARALVRRPAFMIVDEPTSGLDLPSQDLLMRSLADLNAAEGLTILFVTHDLPLSARYGSHVALFVGGTVRAGTTEEVLRPDLLEQTYGLPIALDLHAHPPARHGAPATAGVRGGGGEGEPA
jgi:ABC-type Mn2+/Zn2+ transport system ATPase subunit